jgi:DNA-binding CsgD family transcriptional regulator
MVDTVTSVGARFRSANEQRDRRHLADRLAGSPKRLAHRRVARRQQGFYDWTMLDQAIEHGPSGLRLLSPREREVLGMAAQGLTNQQVAANLEVTVHAVKFHLASIYRKLGVNNRTEAAVVWLRRPPLESASGSMVDA